MAVAAADFYSYAKATGTPLPKSKQEEAQLAPAVNNWKKSRLKAPERERDSGDLGNVLGGGAIAAGLAGAALYGYRRGWGDSPAPRKPAPTGTNLLSEITTNIDKDDERGIRLGKKPVGDTTTTYRSAVTDIPDQPQVQTEVINTASQERDWNIAYARARQEGLSDAGAVFYAKKAVGQPIREDYFPGPETETRKKLSELKLSSPIKDPRSYIESTGAVEPNTLVGQQKTIASELADQSLESANSGYQQMADPIERSVQRDTDSVAIGNKAAQVEALQQELLTGQRSNLGPKPVTTQTRQDGFYTSPRRLSSEAKQYARTGDIGSFTGEAFGGSRLAGATNVPVQRGTPAGGQLQLPIVYSTQDKINPALRTQLVNEGPTYTSVDEYLERYKPAKEEIIESPLAKEIARQDLIDNLYQTKREDQLIKAGLRPGTTKFENALASGWSAKPNIKQTVTSEDFRENLVLPKEVEDYISTKIPETDASNIARDYYNPDTGNIQYPTVKGDAPISRDIYKERVIDNEDLQNAASGTSIRGKSRSLDIQEPKVFTRTDEFTGEVRPDRIGGTLPTGGIPADLQASQLSKQEVVQSIINPSPVSREDLTGGGAGMGVYGRQLGYVPGPESKTVTGLRSTESGKLVRAKPTDVPQTKTGREFNPQTKRDEFRDLSNDTLRKIITQGTYRSGKMGRTAIEAQYELKLRKDLGGKAAENYAPNIEKAKKSMEVSRDIQNIYNSGRPDAQQQVQAYIQGLRKGQQF